MNFIWQSRCCFNLNDFWHFEQRNDKVIENLELALGNEKWADKNIFEWKQCLQIEHCNGSFFSCTSFLCWSKFSSFLNVLLHRSHVLIIFSGIYTFVRCLELSLPSFVYLLFEGFGILICLLFEGFGIVVCLLLESFILGLGSLWFFTLWGLMICFRYSSLLLKLAWQARQTNVSEDSIFIPKMIMGEYFDRNSWRILIPSIFLTGILTRKFKKILPACYTFNFSRQKCRRHQNS